VITRRQQFVPWGKFLEPGVVVGWWWSECEALLDDCRLIGGCCKWCSGWMDSPVGKWNNLKLRVVGWQIYIMGREYWS